jgi:biopolymer transport protein ExbD
VLFLKADQDLPYGFVITVIDIAKKAGVEVLGLVTEPVDEKNRR